MSMIISIFILLLSGAFVMAVLLYSLRILCEGAVEMMVLAAKQPNQLEQKSSKVVAKYAKKMNKVEMQIANILEKQRF